MRLALLLLAAASGAATAQTTADPDARAAATEAKMTEAERYQLLHTVMPLRLGPNAAEPPAGSKPSAGYAPGIARLGIPALTQSDASLGIANPMGARAGDVATALPSSLALAASFDPAVAEAGGAMIGAEARAKGFNILLGGGANLARDPRGGRNFEYVGEDPLLAGMIAGAAIRGTQSQGVVSTTKHFALNDQETNRSGLNAVIDEAALRESDLLAFEIAIEQGRPGSVMCSYNRVNGPYACGSDFLLNQVLKRDWKYPGWVMSDWSAVHDVRYISAGLDQQAGANLDKQIWFDAPLRAEVAAGRVPKARISDAARRVLRSLYAVGADRPLAESRIDYAAHAVVARRAGTDGIVLLKNDGALPIAATAKRILVVGGNANVGVLSGGGSSQVTPVGGAAAVIPNGGPGFLSAFGRQLYMPSSPVDALKKALPGTSIDYDSGYFPEASAALAKPADLVVAFATQWQTEGLDAGSMTLPQGQDALIEALAAANPNLVVVLETGNPVRMPWLAKAKAVVEAWYPGQQGGEAIADILTGAVNPSGRLPLSFAVDERQLPRREVPGVGEADAEKVEVRYTEGADVGYRWFAKTGAKPLFWFGHGLSYTRFEASGLAVTPTSARATIRNVGGRDGADVAQLYLVEAAGKPVLRLAGFAKVPLKAGESRQVAMPIDPRLLGQWAGNGWRVAKGRYVFALGRSAGELGERVAIDLPEQRLNP